MSAAPTAASILRDLDRRAQQRHLDMLADLDTREHDAVRAALARVKGAARIDVRALLDDVRRGIRDAHSFESPAERDAFQQHIADSLAAWRAECDARGVTEPAARYGLMLEMQAATTTTTTTTADAEPDDELDDDAPEQPPKRRGVERKPLRRAGEDSRSRARPAPDPARGVKRARTSPTAFERPFLGGRCLGGAADLSRPYGQSIDYDSSAWVPRPPWLLDPGTDEDETEKDYVTASETRVGA